VATPVEQSSFRASAISPGLLSQINPTALANRILQESRMLGGRDIASLGASLKQLGTTDQTLASTVRNTVTAQLTPVEQGELLRTTSAPTSTAPTSTVAPSEMAVLQRDNFAAYVEKLRPTLAPQDQNNPFAYSLGTDVPIEVKRQVYAEWQSGQNAPRVEIGSMAGANASFDESAGPNGTIRVNADLIGNKDPARQGQFEAFAVWGHLEEVGHWGDMRAQQLMGRPGGDSLGDEGARFAYMSLPSVTTGANPNSFQANYDIKLSNGTTQTVQFDSVVFKALAAEKLSSGSFARENRVGTVEHFGPEGHYQTTYITAAAVGVKMGMTAKEADTMANRMALGSQLPDMLANYDAASQFTAKATDVALDAAYTVATKQLPTTPSWTPAEQRHLENVYEGLHAIPRDSNATKAWLNDERTQTRDFIREKIASGDFLTAGIAIHRYGDLHAHVKPNGTSYSGDFGHGTSGIDPHWPDYLYVDNRYGQAQSWSKATNYQASLSSVIAEGLVARETRLGHTVAPNATRDAASYGTEMWRLVYDTSLAEGAQKKGIFVNGTNSADTTETLFRKNAEAFINAFHAQAGGTHAPLPFEQTGVGGGYTQTNTDVRSLDAVIERFKANQ
jgi:hypothetical protein